MQHIVFLSLSKAKNEATIRAIIFISVGVKFIYYYISIIWILIIKIYLIRYL